MRECREKLVNQQGVQKAIATHVSKETPNRALKKSRAMPEVDEAERLETPKKAMSKKSSCKCLAVMLAKLNR